MQFVLDEELFEIISETRQRMSRQSPKHGNGGVRHVGMKMKAALFHTVLTDEDVVSGGFLPDVVEENEFVNRSVGNLEG